METYRLFRGCMKRFCAVNSSFCDRKSFVHTKKLPKIRAEETVLCCIFRLSYTSLNNLVFPRTRNEL